jgi:hypothetical protein
LVGYLGILQARGPSVNLTLLQRHALNNYPGEGLRGGRTSVTPEELYEGLAAQGFQFHCDPDHRECTSPDAIPYAVFRRALADQRLRNAANASDWARRWSCQPDRGVCIRERYRWYCDVGKHCVSYDPSRWWCAERQEFCFSRVKFGDWNSALQERETIENLTLEPSKVLIYEMAHGLVPIAQEALTRTCRSNGSNHWMTGWARRS